MILNDHFDYLLNQKTQNCAGYVPSLLAQYFRAQNFAATLQLANLEDFKQQIFIYRIDQRTSTELYVNK